MISKVAQYGGAGGVEEGLECWYRGRYDANVDFKTIVVRCG